MLRWEVLKKDEKEANEKGMNKILGFLDKYEPHTHIAFVFDFFSYLGLIVLNIYIAIQLG